MIAAGYRARMIQIPAHPAHLGPADRPSGANPAAGGSRRLTGADSEILGRLRRAQGTGSQFGQSARGIWDIVAICEALRSDAPAAGHAPVTYRRFDCVRAAWARRDLLEYDLRKGSPAFSNCNGLPLVELLRIRSEQKEEKIFA